MIRRIIQKVSTISKPVGVLLIAIALAALLIITKSKPDKAPPQERAWPIEVMTVEPAKLQPEILLHGRVESRQHTTLRGAVTAYVQSTPALEGDYVNKADLLIGLNPIDAELLLAQSEAQVEAAQAELLAEENKNIADLASLELERQLVELVQKSVNREQKLSQQNLASQARVEEVALAAAREKLAKTARELAIKNHEARLKQLQANLSQATADRDLAALNVERTKIRAPFAGIINQRFVAIGDRVSVNDPIIEMYATDALEIRAQLTTDRLKPILQALAQKIPLQGTVIGNQLNVRLDRLAGEIELDEGGIDALFVIDDTQSDLRLGQAVKIQLRLPEVEQALRIPSTALFERKEGHTIYQVIQEGESSRLKAEPVELLGVQYEKDKTFFLVKPTNGVSMVVMTTRLPLARDNLKVQVRG